MNDEAQAQWDKLKDTALFEDKGEAVAVALRTVFKELNDEKRVGGVNIHLRDDDQSKVEIIQFYFEN